MKRGGLSARPPRASPLRGLTLRGHDAAVVKARELLAENLQRVTNHSTIDVDVKPEIDLTEDELREIAEQQRS